MTSFVKDWVGRYNFRKILADWIGEMEFEGGKRHSDGTPIMGKFETEQLFRAGKELLSKPEENEDVVLETLNRVGNVEVRERIYGDPYVENLKWINRRCVAQGEDFEYKATCLCSFPKKDGKVRYVVEDNGRLFIQHGEQIKFIDDRPFDPPPAEQTTMKNGDNTNG